MCNQSSTAVFLLCLLLQSAKGTDRERTTSPSPAQTAPPILTQCDTTSSSSTLGICGFQGSDNITSTNLTADCPLGFYCNDTKEKCECLDAPDQVVSCETDPYLKFFMLDCNCATFDPENNHVVAGSCIYNCENHQTNTSRNKHLNDIVYHFLPNDSSSLDDYMCKPYNRTGELCGRCKPNHYPLAYSFNLTCIPCPNAGQNWVWYIMAAYIPLTFFYIIVLFFKINAVSSYLHPVIFYSQLVSIPALSRIVFLAVQYSPKTFLGTKVVLSLYGIWNLDFFRPFYSSFCLGIGILPTLALEYVIALYPLLLIVLSYILIVLYDRNYRVITTMCSPFRVLFTLFKRSWDIRTSVIDVYSTFFLLSNNKILSVSFDLLAPARVYHLYPDHHNYTLGLYYAGDIQYFGKEHLPYAILAIFLLLVVFFLPVAILALYPFRFFHKLLNLFPFRWYVLHTFVDAFQGCYKDGTQPGTRDCRWFAALYLLFRFIVCFVYSLTLNAIYFPLCSLFVLLLIMLVIVIQPYKPQMASHTTVNAVFFILYAMFYSCISGSEAAGTKAYAFVGFFYTLSIFLSLVPLFCLFGYLFYWVSSRWKFAAQRIRAFRRGYSVVNGVSPNGHGEEYSDRVMNPQDYPVFPAGSTSAGHLPVSSLPAVPNPLRDCSMLKD